VDDTRWVEPERLHGLVKGDVQGVGFRYFLIRRAQALGLKGWVTNRDDGAVEFVAEGGRGKLEELERAAREGPRMARVTTVEVNWSSATGGLDRFDIT
jgi:acylphosphatase